MNMWAAKAVGAIEKVVAAQQRWWEVLRGRMDIGEFVAAPFRTKILKQIAAEKKAEERKERALAEANSATETNLAKLKEETGKKAAKEEDKREAARVAAHTADVKRQEKMFVQELKNAAKVKKAKEEIEEIAAGKDITITQEVSDRLARIGGMIGGGISPQLRIAQRAMEIERRQLDFMERLPKDMARELERVIGLA